MPQSLKARSTWENKTRECKIDKDKMLSLIGNLFWFHHLTKASSDQASESQTSTAVLSSLITLWQHGVIPLHLHLCHKEVTIARMKTTIAIPAIPPIHTPPTQSLLIFYKPISQYPKYPIRSKEHTYHLRLDLQERQISPRPSRTPIRIITRLTTISPPPHYIHISYLIYRPLPHTVLLNTNPTLHNLIIPALLHHNSSILLTSSPTILHSSTPNAISKIERKIIYQRLPQSHLIHDLISLAITQRIRYTQYKH